MATKPKKSWREKLADDKDLPKIIRVDAQAAARWGGSSVAIAAPREIDGLMRSIPTGHVTTMNELRKAIARKHRTETTCPITTGIFSWIAANAAEEAAAAGEKNITPYWRTLKTGGELNPKYPGGLAGVQSKLAAEGHAFVRKGRRMFVRDLDRVIFKPVAK
jgi:hypothetical protein